MPEDMPEDLPEDMSEYMPEDMSDRMPEDLPVRECINVMVGITRSKVFFFCEVDWLVELNHGYVSHNQRVNHHWLVISNIWIIFHDIWDNHLN